MSTKKTYVTFGQGHVHHINGKTFDGDCVAVVNGDRAKVFELFGSKFCFEFTEERWDHKQMKFFPRGYIEICKTPTQQRNESFWNSLGFEDKLLFIKKFPFLAKYDKDWHVRQAYYNYTGWTEDARKDSDWKIRLSYFSATGNFIGAMYDTDENVQQAAKKYFDLLTEYENIKTNSNE